MQDYHYCVAVDGRWMGRFRRVDPKIQGLGRFYAVRCYDRERDAVKAARRKASKLKGICKRVQIYKSWGSGPKQREVIKTIKCRGLPPPKVRTVRRRRRR